MEYLIPSPHFQSVCVPRSEMGLLWTGYIWVLLLYPKISIFLFVSSPCVYSYSVYSEWDSLCFLDRIYYFLSYVKEVFGYNLFSYFLRHFIFFLLDPYNSNVDEFNFVPEVSKSILNFSHLSFLFSSSTVISTISHLVYPFFCLKYFATDSY